MYGLSGIMGNSSVMRITLSDVRKSKSKTALTNQALFGRKQGVPVRLNAEMIRLRKNELQNAYPDDTNPGHDGGTALIA